MINLFIIAFLFLLPCVYQIGRLKAIRLSISRSSRLKSIPHHHGMYVFFSALLPALMFLTFSLTLEKRIVTNLVLSALPVNFQYEGSNSMFMTEIQNIENGSLPKEMAKPEILTAALYLAKLNLSVPQYRWIITFILATLGAVYGTRRIAISFQAREKLEQVFRLFLMLSGLLAVFITFGIFFSLIFETIRFFKLVPISDFLFGLDWQPQMAIRADQVASAGAFGAIPVFVGTVLICFIAMCVALPLGLMSAIYLSEYASPKFRAYAKPALEILAGIPTVVYGFFAALIVAPFIRDIGIKLGYDVSSESALAAGAVMGVMIIPFISSLSDDVINSVPQTLRDASYALGATKAETIKKVVFPAALPGITGAVLLGVSRAIGETMIVVMAAGLVAKLTLNPLENVTTATVQIVTTLVGDQEFNSAKTLSAFAIGLVLFLVTLFLNYISFQVVQKYKEQYE